MRMATANNKGKAVVDDSEAKTHCTYHSLINSTDSLAEHQCVQERNIQSNKQTLQSSITLLYVIIICKRQEKQNLLEESWNPFLRKITR